MTEEDKPQKHITVKVQGTQGETMFKIKGSTKMSKLMQAYCSSSNLNVNAVRFQVNGDRIDGEQTAEQLGLADGDVIDVFSMMVGGCF